MYPMNLKFLITKHCQFILYGLIGAFCSTLDFIIYTIFLWFTNDKFVLFANTLGVLAGIVTSFLLNRQYNFKVKDNTAKRFAVFLTIGLTGLALSTLFIFILVDVMHWNIIYSKLATIFIVAVFQFVLNKTITFKK